MSHCNDENLRDLRTAYKEKKIFDKSINSDTFSLLCEILKNLELKKKFKKCFSKSIIKKKKKHAKIIKNMLDGDKPLENRIKKFAKAKKSFKKWLRSLVKRFFKKCLVLLCE